MWASINPGRTVFPDIFRTSVSGPMRESQAVLSPIAINLPSDIASELAFGVRGIYSNYIGIFYHDLCMST